MVRDHVAGQPDAASFAALPQVRHRVPAADFRGDLVVVQRVGRRFGVRVAAEVLDPLAGRRALPETDEPEGGEAFFLQLVQLCVGNLVQPGDRPTVALGQLVEPDQRALGHHDHVRHPVLVRGVRLVLLVHVAVVRHERRSGASCFEAGLVLLFHDGYGPHQIQRKRLGDVGGPGAQDVLDLVGQACRMAAGWFGQQGEQVELAASGLECAGPLHALLDDPDQVSGLGGKHQVFRGDEGADGLLEGRVDLHDPVDEEAAEVLRPFFLSVGFGGSQKRRGELCGIERQGARGFRVEVGQRLGEDVPGHAVQHALVQGVEQDRGVQVGWRKGSERKALGFLVVMKRECVRLLVESLGTLLVGEDRPP